MFGIKIISLLCQFLIDLYSVMKVCKECYAIIVFLFVAKGAIVELDV